jgi:dTMP kinase
MKNTRYVVFEGTEGVGKTTQTNLLVKYLTDSGFKVLNTKEPGSPFSPLTMVMRGIMLDKQYDEQLTQNAREYVSQAIRSIHLEKIIYPAMGKYDFIIQDRGMLSGLAYGTACGNKTEWIESMMRNVVGLNVNPYNLYSDIVYMRGNVDNALQKAKSSKQEFAAGDAIEAKGNNFMKQVSDNMNNYSKWFNGVKYIEVDNKNINQVFDEILRSLDIKDSHGYQEY